MRPMTRRQFLQIGAGSLGAATLGTGALLTVVAGAAPRPGGGGGSGGTVVRNELQIPAAWGGGTLTAQAGVEAIGTGRTTNALRYNNQFPGPTIVVDKGSTFTAVLDNQLADHSMIHWHGLVVPEIHDGQPQDAVPAKGTRTYGPFPVDQRASLNFYHPHPHQHTASQVYFGLAGAFVIRDLDGEEADLPAVVREVPLLIRDASFDSAGNLAYGGKASGFLGKEPMVNGTLAPSLLVDRGIYRFRIVNAATARIFRLSLAGLTMHLIGNDGGLLPEAVAVETIDLSPGERADVLVDFRTAATKTAALRCALAGWTLLEFQVSDVVASSGSLVLPSPLSTITALPAPSGPVRRISFDGMTRVNGKVYDPNTPLFTVPAGVVEDWMFTTNGNAPHPVHVHGASFQVQGRTGGRGGVFPWEAGWKDTVLLHDGESVTVRLRFEDWQKGNRYLIHCHKLEHEDAGMMARFDVV